MFIPIVLALAAGGLLVGCGGRNESAAAGGSADVGTPPPPPGSGSSYAAATVPSPLIASATPRPNPTAVGMAAPEFNLISIGTAPTGASLATMTGANDEERIRTWRNQNAMAGYIQAYVTNTSTGLARTDAIEQLISLIERRMSGDHPIRVRYTVDGTERTDTLNETADGSPNNAVTIFIQELIRTHPEARAEIQAIQARLAAHSPAGAGSAAPNPRPRPPASAGGNPAPRRPSAPPPPHNGPDVFY